MIKFSATDFFFLFFVCHNLDYILEHYKYYLFFANITVILLHHQNQSILYHIYQLFFLFSSLNTDYQNSVNRYGKYYYFVNTYLYLQVF